MKKLFFAIISLITSFVFLVSTTYAVNTNSIDLELNSAQYLSKISAGSLTIASGGITIEIWVKAESLPALAGVVSLVAVSTFENNYNLRIDAGKISFNYRDAANTVWEEWKTTNAVIEIEKWYHIAFYLTFGTAASAGVRLYDKTADISSSPAGSWVGGTGGTLPSTHATPVFRVGEEATNVRYFDGLIDDVRMWNDIRTTIEIDDNKSLELVGNESNLIGYWKLNNDLLDETTNNNDLTNNNSAVFSTDVPFVGTADAIPYKPPQEILMLE